MTRALLAALAALALAAPAAQAAAPVAATGAVRDVAQTSATLTATVDPNGEATTVRFDLGTTTAYGVESPSRTVEGDDPVAVEVPVAGLTPSTTYHVRVVAVNATDRATGADRTFRTATPPRPPGIVTGGARDIAGDAATLTGTVDGNGAETRWHFELGTSTRYGRTTPAQVVTRPDGRVTVTSRVTGLRAGARYAFRLVGTNAAGRTAGRNRTFRADRRLTAIGVTAIPSPAQWGAQITVPATLEGGAPAGVPLVLERQEWPYTGPFNPVGRALSTSRSGLAQFVLPVYRSVRLRARGGGLTSPAITVLARPKVGMRVTRTRTRVRVSGTVWPRVPGARVSLQRRTASGRWAPVTRGLVIDATGDRSRYALEAARTLRPATWRVVVVPAADGAYVRGVSRERVVPGRLR